MVVAVDVVVMQHRTFHRRALRIAGAESRSLRSVASIEDIAVEHAELDGFFEMMGLDDF